MILKKYIPDILKPLAREIKFRLSKDRSEEKLKVEVEDLKGQWGNVIANSEDIIKQIQLQEKGKHVLFVTGYGLGAHYLAIEPTIMMSLFVRGCRISSLYCNKSLPACEFNLTGNCTPPVENTIKKGISQKVELYQCNKCSSNLSTIYAGLPVELYGYNKYLEPEDLILTQSIVSEVSFDLFRHWEYQGIKIGEEVFASVLRATFMGTIIDTPQNRWLVLRYLLSAVLMAIAARRAYESLKPDRIVLIHGVYLTHGIAMKVANSMGIPVAVVVGGSIKKDTIVICHNETYINQLINEPNSVWEKFNLSEKEKEETLNYAIKKRSAGSGVDYLTYHESPIEDVEKMYSILNIDKSRDIVAVYTNVIWDAQIFYKSNVFNNIFDWLYTTIEELGKNDKVWGIIRIHPAEKKGASPTNQPMADEINMLFPKLPDNIRIISPESDISSYALAKVSKASIIYGTKMALEIALLKVPLIICGETFSRGKGYGTDISSKDQYLDILASIQNYPTQEVEMYERALRYAHYFYFRRMIDLPIETQNVNNTGGRRKLAISSLDDLLPGKLSGIDTICDGIINLTPFFIGAE